jgi:hypothetical protein
MVIHSAHAIITVCARRVKTVKLALQIVIADREEPVMPVSKANVMGFATQRKKVLTVRIVQHTVAVLTHAMRHCVVPIAVYLPLLVVMALLIQVKNVMTATRSRGMVVTKIAKMKHHL